MTYSSKYQSAGVNTPWIFCAFFMDLNFRDSVIGNLDEAEIKTIENKLPSPFTQEEEEWLQQVMEHYAMKAGLLQDENIDRL